MGVEKGLKYLASERSYSIVQHLSVKRGKIVPTCVPDPEPHWIRIHSGPCIQGDSSGVQKRKNENYFIFLTAGLREVLSGGLSFSKSTEVLSTF
jgi:hypothetical protein